MFGAFELFLRHCCIPQHFAFNALLGLNAISIDLQKEKSWWAGGDSNARSLGPEPRIIVAYIMIDGMIPS
jgi:hypothetical protein